MRKMFVGLILSLLVFSVIAGSAHSSPGPLAGTWQLSGHADKRITFRDSEAQANGVVEKVHYQVHGKNVFVTYLDGLAKGMTMRYHLINPDTAVTHLGTLKRLVPLTSPSQKG